jgi:dolichol kinase
MAWGFGDAAAALVGKAFGRNRILHPRIEGAKTYEGTLAMIVVAGLAIFLTLLVYAGQPWKVSLTVAALVAPVSATVELFSNRGMDTLTVPLSVAFLVLHLMSLFSSLGV